MNRRPVVGLGFLGAILDVLGMQRDQVRAMAQAAPVISPAQVQITTHRTQPAGKGVARRRERRLLGISARQQRIRKQRARWAAITAKYDPGLGRLTPAKYILGKALSREGRR